MCKLLFFQNRLETVSKLTGNCSLDVFGKCSFAKSLEIVCLEIFWKLFASMILKLFAWKLFGNCSSPKCFKGIYLQSVRKMLICKLVGNLSFENCSEAASLQSVNLSFADGSENLRLQTV